MQFTNPKFVEDLRRFRREFPQLFQDLIAGLAHRADGASHEAIMHGRPEDRYEARALKVITTALMQASVEPRPVESDAYAMRANRI